MCIYEHIYNFCLFAPMSDLNELFFLMLCEEAFGVHKKSFRATSYSIQCNRCVDFASPKFIKTLR